MDQRKSQLDFGDVPDSGGTLTFDYPKVTGQAEISLCNLVVLVTVHTHTHTMKQVAVRRLRLFSLSAFLEKQQIPPHLG